METLEIIVPHKACAYNNANKSKVIFNKKSRRYSTIRYRVSDIEQKLSLSREFIYKNYAKERLLFAKAYDEKIHAIKCEYTTYIQEDKFFTKKGTISKVSGDRDGYVKLQQDIVFDFLGINDAVIIDGPVRKLPANQFAWGVSLSLIPYPQTVQLAF